jgi:hypothetical protein
VQSQDLQGGQHSGFVTALEAATCAVFVVGGASGSIAGMKCSHRDGKHKKSGPEAAFQ